jgi:hypothetical protein
MTLPKKNNMLINRNKTFVRNFLLGTDTNDYKCRQLVDVGIEELKKHFESLWSDDMNWENFRKTWDIGFVFTPTAMDMANPHVKGIAFSVHNMYPKHHI